MFHGLGQQTGIEGRGASIFFGDLLALFDNAVDGRAFLAVWFLSQVIEDLFALRDLFLGRLSGPSSERLLPS